MACNRQYFPLLNLPLHTGLGQSLDGRDIWRTKNGSNLGSACFLLDSAPFWISPGFSLCHMFPCISKKPKWFFSSCRHSCTDILISMHPLGEGTKAGGWFNWSGKIITGKCLKLLPYLWGYMQSSLMRERTCCFPISPLQTIPWAWLNIWVIQLPHLSDLHVHQDKPNSLLYTISCYLTWQQFYLHCWNSQWKRDLRAWARDPPT